MDQIARLIRWREWAEPKLAIYSMIICYIVVVDQRFTLEFIKDYIPLICFLFLYITYLYVVNEYSDRELDRQVGKTNIIGELSNRAAIGIVISIFALGVLATSPLFINPYFVYVLVASYFLATFYSLPPIRFKVRGLLGIITVTLAEDVLSIMLIFSGLRHFVFLDMLLFTLYQVGFGVKEITKHQIKDLQNDLRGGITTFTTEKGVTKVWKLFVSMYALERLALILILVWMSLQIFPTVALLLPYIATNVYMILLRKKAGNHRGLLPESLSGEGRTLGYIYPRLFIPFFLLIFVINYPILFIVLFMVTCIWTYKLAKFVLRELKNSLRL